MQRASWWWLGSAVAVLAACSSPDVCAGIACGEGHCVVDRGVAACLCDEGYRASGLICVSVLEPPCSPATCAGLPNDACVVDAGAAACVCPDAKVLVDGVCLVPGPCVPSPCTSPHQSVCETDGGTFRCLCDVGHAPAGDGCEASATWDCTAQHAAPDGDAHEPDECPALAGPLEPLTGSAHAIAPPGDHDWFRLEVTPSHVYRLRAALFDADRGGVLLEVFDQAGLVLRSSDLHAGPAAEARFGGPVTGAVMARVRGVRQTDTFRYTLSLEDLGPDDFADDGAAATTLTLPVRFEGAVQFPGDRDEVWLELPAATAVHIAAGAMDGGTADLALELWSADGGPSRTLVDDATTVSSPTEDRLLLVMRGRTAQALGSFSVSTTTLGPDDACDDPVFAEVVTPSSAPRSLTVERVGDVDSFRVPQVEGHAYEAQCQTAGWWSCIVSVRSADGSAVGMSSSIDPKFVQWRATGGDAVSVSIGMPESSSYTGVALARIEDVGADDYPDPPSLGAPVSLGTGLEGRLELPSDVDVFQLSAPAGQIVRVSATCSGNCEVRVWEGSSNQTSLAGASGGAPSVAVVSPATGALRVQVSFAYSPPVGPYLTYQLRFEDLGRDDYGNHGVDAASLPLGDTATGVLQYPDDSDWFAVPVQAGHVYFAECSRANGAGCPLAVRDPSLASLVTGDPAARFVAPLTGTLFLQVGPALEGPFSLVVSEVGIDDHGDDAATATAITPGVPVTGVMQAPNDIDALTFASVAQEVYGVACAATSAQCTTRISAPGVAPWQKATFKSPGGPLTIAVTTTPLAPWSLVVTDLGTDDHGDDAATASSLAPAGGSLDGALTFEDDVDVFDLGSLVAGDVVRVTATLLAGDPFQASIHDSANNLLQWPGIFGPGETGFRAPASGPYTLQVRGAVGTRYRLQTAAGTDDHGNTVQTSTLIGLGQTATGVIDYPGDRDVFRVSLSANVARTLSAFASGCSVLVVAPGGIPIVNTSGVVNSPFTPTQTGAHWLVVDPLPGQACDPYQLSVQ